MTVCLKQRWSQSAAHATSPAPSTLTLPYSDNYDADATNSEPRYLSTMQGAYAHAIEVGYRFYSYGDASLLWRQAP